MPEDTISKLAAYGMLIDAQAWLRKQPGTEYAVSLLRKAEIALRCELWSRHGFAHEPRKWK